MSDNNFEWSRFTVRIDIKNTNTEKLYRAWATRSGIEYWFLRMSEYIKPGGGLRNNDELVQKGDGYRWRWFGYSDEVTETGEILDCNGKDFFKFSFGKAGNCSVRIYEEEGEKIVELMQDEIATDDKSKSYFHVGCKTGWTFYLANMKSLYEGGIDLRNRNEKLQQMVNA
jgi:hypothetical protein